MKVLRQILRLVASFALLWCLGACTRCECHWDCKRAQNTLGDQVNMEVCVEDCIARN